MNPKAVEALQKAKALFAHPAEVSGVQSDEIPEQITQAPEPIRKPRVVLIPTNAPKFDQHSMKEEHKQMAITSGSTPLQPVGALTPTQTKATKINFEKQTDKYVDMSTSEACADCIKKGITKPSEIAKVTGKSINQIYTAMWHLRKGTTKKFKSIKKKIPAPYACNVQPQEPTPKQQADMWNEVAKKLPTAEEVWNREPTAWEDAHHVVFKSRAEYDAEVERLNLRISDLLIEKQELKTIIKYLEGKAI